MRVAWFDQRIIASGVLGTITSVGLIAVGCRDSSLLMATGLLLTGLAGLSKVMTP